MEREQNKEGTSLSPPTPTPSRSDLPYNQSRCCKLCKYTSLVAKQVCLGSVKGSTDFVQILLQNVEHLSNLSAATFRNLQQPYLLQNNFWRIHSGKRTKSLLNPF